MNESMKSTLKMVMIASLATLPSAAKAMNHQNQAAIPAPCNGTMMSTPPSSARERPIDVSLHDIEQAYMAALNWLRQNNHNGAQMLTPPVTMVREQQLRQGGNYQGGSTFVDAQSQIYAHGHTIFTEFYVDNGTGPQNTQRIVIRADGNHEGFYSPDHYQHFCAIPTEAQITNNPTPANNTPSVHPSFKTPNR